MLFVPFFHSLLLFTFILTDVPIILPSEDELVFTERHLGQELQASETELPSESAGKQTGVVLRASRDSSSIQVSSSPSPEGLTAHLNLTQNRLLCLPTWVSRVLRLGKPFAKLYVKPLGLP